MAQLTENMFVSSIHSLFLTQRAYKHSYENSREKKRGGGQYYALSNQKSQNQKSIFRLFSFLHCNIILIKIKLIILDAGCFI